MGTCSLWPSPTEVGVIWESTACDWRLKWGQSGATEPLTLNLCDLCTNSE